jgi:phosphoglycolate phosphatase
MPFLFSQIEAFLFDFDGTLAQLNINFKAIKEAIILLAASYGLQNSHFPDPPYLLELSQSLRDQIGVQNPEAAVSFYDKAMSLIAQAEWQAARPENLYPITPLLLAKLKEKNIKRAVLTRNSGSSVYRVFPDLDRYVEIFLPREKVTNPKPDQHHVLKALSGLNVPAEKTVMVGDHPLDILAGQMTGTFTIGVLSGRTGEREMKNAGADLILPHVGYLIDLV